MKKNGLPCHWTIDELFSRFSIQMTWKVSKRLSNSVQHWFFFTAYTCCLLYFFFLLRKRQSWRQERKLSRRSKSAVGRDSIVWATSSWFNLSSPFCIKFFSCYQTQQQIDLFEWITSTNQYTPSICGFLFLLLWFHRVNVECQRPAPKKKWGNGGECDIVNSFCSE